VKRISASHFSVVLIVRASLFARGGCEIGINVLHSDLGE
jgi:hypothetical protein